MNQPWKSPIYMTINSKSIPKHEDLGEHIFFVFFFCNGLCVCVCVCVCVSFLARALRADDEHSMKLWMDGIKMCITDK